MLAGPLGVEHGALADSIAQLDGLSGAEETLHGEGKALFETRREPAGAESARFGGLGPTFNARACVECHRAAGRGSPAEPGRPLATVLLRLSTPGAPTTRAHPAYGEQLNPLAVAGIPAEGRAYVEYGERRGAFLDGTRYTLRRPAYGLFRLAFGQLEDDVPISARLAPSLQGLGLLEAVSERAILARADPEDRDGDGISGRAHWRTGPDGVRRLGRFGWRAEQTSLRRQTAHALLQDMGITTSLFPRENCPPVQRLCAAAPSAGTPEASDAELDALAFYIRTLAPPMSRPGTDRGRGLFSEAGCGACHRPRLETGAHPVAALSHRVFAPYTDLLLHDMGDGLADRRMDGTVANREWRTAPLWGLASLAETGGERALLHDGRARTIAEAILWHGGEAEAAKERFRAMPRSDRDALLAFLGSL